MTRPFDWCAPGPPGARPDAAHDACPRVFTDSNGTTHRCGCPLHQSGERRTPIVHAKEAA